MRDSVQVRGTKLCFSFRQECESNLLGWVATAQTQELLIKLTNMVVYRVARVQSTPFNRQRYLPPPNLNRVIKRNSSETHESLQLKSRTFWLASAVPIYMAFLLLIKETKCLLALMQYDLRECMDHYSQYMSQGQ